MERATVFKVLRITVLVLSVTLKVYYIWKGSNGPNPPHRHRL
jgi:hypothetical protein